MWKKVLGCVMAVSMVATISSIGAFAKDDEEKGISEVDKANAKIEKTIDKVLEQGDVTQAEIDKLIDKTNKAAEKGIEKAEKDGVQVECEQQVVDINGEPTIIDPLRVIRA